MNPVFILNASDGDLLIYEHKVTIRSRGILAKMAKGSTGEKDIDLHAITAVQLKKPGLTVGFIQLTIKGESAKRGGSFNAVKDENALTLRWAKQYKQAVQAKDMIERVRVQANRPATPPPDFADQIRRLKELHDQGLLTASEFEQKKTEILSRL